MRNKAQVLLNDEMASYLIEQFDKGSIIYTSESIVLENGELVNRITFDGCDPICRQLHFPRGSIIL